MPTPVRRRPHWLVTVSCFVLACGATAAATWHEPRADTSAAAHAGASASPTASGGAASGGTRLQFGLDFSDTLGFESPQALGHSLDDAVKLGAQYIRVDFAWEDYQSTSSSFAPDFSRFDRVVAAANARHLRILATLGFPPVWARASSCRGSAACPPASATGFADFAAQAAAHYAPLGVHDWEVWNEPNIPSWAPKPDPAAYANLLTTTAKALHGADSKAYVLMGGLAAERPHPGIPYIKAADFITAVAKAGGLADVQAVAYHPYPGQPNAAVSASIEVIDSTPDNIVEALSKAGHPTMPIWITETGASVPAARHGAHPAPGQIAAQQAAQAATARSLVTTLSHTANVAAMFWFDDEDQPSVGLVYGLRSSSGVARPAFAALRTAIEQNRGK